MKRYNKILIIQTAFIGDVILATALVEKLHHFYPNTKIDFLLRKGNESLLKDHPILNEVLIWDKKKKKYPNLLKIIRTVRSNKYDVVVNIQRFTAAALVTLFSGAKLKLSFDKSPFSFAFTTVPHKFGDGTHEVVRNLSLIESITNDEFVKPKLYPSNDDFEAFRPSPPFITIAPTSVWFTKQWPANKWIELIQKTDSFYSIYLLGAPNDHEACENIRKQSERKNVINLAGKLSLLQSAALMSKAAMNYVNDSAPLHLASAMNAPVTAIFCSTVPEFGFTPLSSESRILQSSENLACRPCGMHGHKACPEGHFKCTKIEVEGLKAK